MQAECAYSRLIANETPRPFSRRENWSRLSHLGPPKGGSGCPNLRHLGGPKDVRRFGDLFAGPLKHFRREVSSGAYSPTARRCRVPAISRVGHRPISHCYPILNQDALEIQVGPERYGPYPSTRRPYCLRTISNENLTSMTGPCSSRTAIAI